MKLEKAQQLVKDYEEEYLSNHPMFTDDDMETLIWMVEQAEKVQELERANERLEKENAEMAEVLREAGQYISNGYEFGYIDDREGYTDNMIMAINRVLRKKMDWSVKKDERQTRADNEAL